jgi:hypothetical protein
LIYAWSEREVLYDSKNPEYFKKDAKWQQLTSWLKNLASRVRIWIICIYL